MCSFVLFFVYLIYDLHICDFNLVNFVCWVVALRALQMAGSAVLPGVRLCPADSTHQPGPGTFTQHGYLYSSLVGELRLTTQADSTVTVAVEGGEAEAAVPAQQDIVTARVLSVNPRFAKVRLGKHWLSIGYRDNTCHMSPGARVVCGGGGAGPAIPRPDSSGGRPRNREGQGGDVQGIVVEH